MNTKNENADLWKGVLWMLSPLVVTFVSYGINTVCGYLGAMAYLGVFYWMLRKP